MDVLIDYRPALRARTGVGEYVHELVDALAGLPGRPERLHVFSSSWKDRLDPALAGRWPGVVLHDRRVPVGLLHLAWNRLSWPSAERLLRLPLDVVHAAHPLIIPSRHAASVVTIHDLDFLDHPERTRAEVRRDFPALVRSHAQRADGILTSSRHSAEQIVGRLGVPADRVAIARPGVPTWARAPREQPRQPGGYILFLGTLEPRKNLGTLLDAYARLAADPAVPGLRVAGADTPAAAPWLARLQASPLAGRATYVGYVADTARRALFEGASMLVIPSWHEGFGLPALEALALGVPVVASAVGALPEVVGDAGLLVEPGDANAWAAAIRRMLHEPGLADTCATRGMTRVREWSWQAAAGAVRGLYADAHARRLERHARRG